MEGLGMFQRKLLNAHVFQIGAFEKLPPGIMGTASILPFIDIDRFVTQGLKVVIHRLLHAADRGQYADNAKNAKRDPISCARSCLYWGSRLAFFALSAYCPRSAACNKR